ncbi:iron complex outermembrane receptor protein [Chitinophaga skermanii]|uniref:Iron complex outermembrane receptor protein n=1 Tax=Chitinophaga skermanii TaxID=331697 RepID=A0A327QG15_9BACT|nr:SusC/RagA family TonB-linked outer membrane protein [Chitinophaga skermanii]RAJ02582.1 iron complex outermembrane receptor protein [Chitinophaga skermanii]
MKRSLLVFAVFFAMCQIVLAQGKKAVTGTVKDAKGDVLIGVSVQEKGTTNGAVTDVKGHFSLSVAPNATLILTYVGYAKQEVAVGDRSTLSIILQEDNKNLNEVVVTAMGVKKEARKLGYAVTALNGDDLKKSAPTSIGAALYGKAPGVTISGAPGGATSAVAIQIRGVNSLTNNAQPLVVVDGVPIRNGDANTGDYYADTRIRGNGLLDINPENIESLNILKGAAASALYGSDAAAGVIVITTKTGKKGKGLGIDFSATYGIEKVGILPDIQNVYGPGYDRETNKASFGADDDGWIQLGDINGDGIADKRPIYRSYAQFGPKFDGSDISYWTDGSIRKYNAHPDNWKNFYRTGNQGVYNIAVSNSNENVTYRLSYTRNDYRGVQIGGDQGKNTFNLNTSIKITKRLTADVIASYINEKVHNRPELQNRISGNYGGMFSSADDINDYFATYKNKAGYKYYMYNSPIDPNDRLKYHIRAYDFMDFLWKQLQNSYDETSNRYMTAATLNYDFGKGLRLRGRMGNDYTGYRSEFKEYSTQPTAFDPTGGFTTANEQHSILYGDVMLMYNKSLTKNLGLNVNAGYQARKEEYRYETAATNGGLVQENWFSLANGAIEPSKATSTRKSFVKDAYFATVGFDINNYLFLEATGRYERASTLAPDNNAFFYPSLSAAFELSKAFKLPEFVTYSKLRASWGIVGNPPVMYAANVMYVAGRYTIVNPTTGTNGNFTYYYPDQNQGNLNLENEKKREVEIGWETKFLNNRVGFDVAFYQNVTNNQILKLDNALSAGSVTMLRNVGSMQNTGVELSVNGTPIQTKSFQWNARVNVAYNKNKVKELANGIDQVIVNNVDNGSLNVVAKAGSSYGDIYGYKRMTNENGEYLINNDGYYVLDYSKMQKLGNTQSKYVGGMMNSFNYKNWNLDALVDFRYGGQLISTTNYYGTGAGLFTNSLEFRDAEHGGLAYYKDAAGNKVLVSNGGAPAGAKIYNDGVLLKGVKEDGKTPNDKVVEAAEYYLNSYGWGGYPGSGSNLYEKAIYDNNYIKLREVTLGYTFRTATLQKIRFQNLNLSVFARNPLYIYKSIPNIDPEAAVGTTIQSRNVETGTTASTRTFGVSLRASF